MALPKNLQGLRLKEKKLKFKINEHLSLELVKNKTMVLLDGKQFTTCKYLILNIPVNQTYKYDQIESIDHLIEETGGEFQHTNRNKKQITHDLPTPEEESEGHCSNLQAWVEHDYDTRLIDSRLAFPILRKLADKGDLKAKKFYKEELAYRLLEGHNSIFHYVQSCGFLRDYTMEELKTLRTDLIEKGLHFTHGTISGISSLITYKFEHALEEKVRLKKEAYDRRRMARLNKMYAIQKKAFEKDQRKKQQSLLGWVYETGESPLEHFLTPYKDYHWLIQMIFRHSVMDVAKRCNVNKSTIYYWIHQHRIDLRSLNKIKRKLRNQYKNKQYQY